MTAPTDDSVNTGESALRVVTIVYAVGICILAAISNLVIGPWAYSSVGDKNTPLQVCRSTHCHETFTRTEFRQGTTDHCLFSLPDCFVSAGLSPLPVSRFFGSQCCLICLFSAFSRRRSRCKCHLVTFSLILPGAYQQVPLPSLACACSSTRCPPTLCLPSRPLPLFFANSNLSVPKSLPFARPHTASMSSSKHLLI